MQDPIQEKVIINQQVPEIIDQRIASTISRIRQGEKRQFNNKKLRYNVLVAICVLLFSTLVVAAVNNGLDVLLNKFLPMASKSYEEIKVEVKDGGPILEDKKDTFVATTIRDQGITVKVNEIAYDGTALIFKYAIEAKDIDFPYEQGAIFAPFLYIGDQRIENITSVQSIGRWTTPINYEGYYSFNFDWTKQVAENYGNVKIGIKEVFEIRGDWEIKTNISLKDIYKAPRIYKINEIQYIEGLEVKIEELCISPFSNQLTYTIYNIDEFNQENMKGFEKIRFFVLDEKGNCLNYRDTAESEWVIIGETATAQKIYDNKAYNVHGTMELMKLSETPKTLTFIPYKNYSYQSIGTESFNINETGAEVHINDEFTLNIKNIEKQKDVITLEYTYEGLVPERMNPSVTFLDKKGNDITIRDNYSVTQDSETGISYASYKTNNPEEIAQIQVEKYFSCDIIRESKFIVKLHEASRGLDALQSSEKPQEENHFLNKDKVAAIAKNDIISAITIKEMFSQYAIPKKQITMPNRYKEEKRKQLVKLYNGNIPIDESEVNNLLPNEILRPAQLDIQCFEGDESIYIDNICIHKGGLHIRVKGIDGFNNMLNIQSSLGTRYNNGWFMDQAEDGTVYWYCYIHDISSIEDLEGYKFVINRVNE